MQKITPCLWLNGNAQEALDYYLSVFKDAKVTSKSYYGEGMHLPKGSLLTAMISVFGQDLMFLNADHPFEFTHALSLVINCKDQAEVDYYWERLTEDGGVEEQCSWVKDKFGLSWQVVPEIMVKILSQSDKEKTDRVMKVMMTMKKLNIAELEAAAK
ncbi:VOC family protein [soil metagenome]